MLYVNPGTKYVNPLQDHPTESSSIFEESTRPSEVGEKDEDDQKSSSALKIEEVNSSAQTTDEQLLEEDDSNSQHNEKPDADVISDMEPVPAKASTNRQQVEIDYFPKPALNFAQVGRHGNCNDVKGSSKSTVLYRKVKYPFAWAYNKVVGYRSVDEVGIMGEKLPLFYVIPEDSQLEVLPLVKKHALQLRDGRWVVAKKDMSSCRDSQRWYKKEKKLYVPQNLLMLKYTKALIDELESLSTREFGRYLLELWDSGKVKAREEIAYQKRIRGEL